MNEVGFNSEYKELQLRYATLREQVANKIELYTHLVEMVAGGKIGYVPRKHNRILSNLMDAGKLLSAKVVSKELKNKWLYIRVAIRMTDI